MFQNIPEELQRLRQWICWRYEQDAQGKQTKIPRTTTGQPASVTDPNTWTTFNEAVAAAPHFSGIGFVLTEEDPYCILDLDNKPENPCTEEQLARHTAIYNFFESYTELSVSGTGVHIVVRGQLPDGVKRDHVEAYSSKRYIVFTGQVLRRLPINDYHEAVQSLHRQMKGKSAHRFELTETPETLSDADLVDMAMRASNGEKFNQLCAGHWQTEYPSQSEADFALLSILAFYTKSNAQLRRIFRMTALGKRDKATRNDTYLNFAISKIRASEVPPVDASALLAKPKELAVLNTITPPPGLVGDLATYFYNTAVRPVPEIALAAAIALVGGVCARSYNISESGLNQYIILLAKTGSGKEGALSGIDRLIAAVRPQVPVIDQFIGPAAFASGQGLLRALGTQPCFVSVLGEFGLTLQHISGTRANGAEIMLRRVLLDLYSKSGYHQILRPMVYADSEKNIEAVHAPNVTLLGESTPETFFDGLDASHIAEGLIPRFTILEYVGHRPARNRNANRPPPPELIQRFIDLAVSSLTISNNNTVAQVETAPDALALLDAFDTKADQIINASQHQVEAQLWNRAHLKALRLAALLAVGVNPYKPLVTADLARWAIEFTSAEITAVVARFGTGDVGSGDTKQFNDLKRIIENHFQKPSVADAQLAKAGLVSYRTLLRRVACLASYRSDKLGATKALQTALKAMVDSGMLVELNKLQVMEKYGFSGICYSLSGSWSAVSD